MDASGYPPTPATDSDLMLSYEPDRVAETARGARARLRAAREAGAGCLQQGGSDLDGEATSTRSPNRVLLLGGQVHGVGPALLQPVHPTVPSIRQSGGENTSAT